MREATHLNPDEKLATVEVSLRGQPLRVKERYEGQFQRDPATGQVTEACRKSIESNLNAGGF